MTLTHSRGHRHRCTQRNTWFIFSPPLLHLHTHNKLPNHTKLISQINFMRDAKEADISTTFFLFLRPYKNWAKRLFINMRIMGLSALSDGLAPFSKSCASDVMSMFITVARAHRMNTGTKINILYMIAHHLENGQIKIWTCGMRQSSARARAHTQHTHTNHRSLHRIFCVSFVSFSMNPKNPKRVGVAPSLALADLSHSFQLKYSYF